VLVLKKLLTILEVLTLGWIIIWLFASVPAIEAREIEDLNLTERITLTLANSISERYQYGADDVGELMERADFYIDEEEGIYSYSFRIRVDSFRGSGYHRISSLARYPKPKTEEGWRLLGEDPETRTKVWFREVRRSEADVYNEVQASLKSGNLALTVSLRRPAEEPPSQAQKVILERFRRLIDNAQRYGILSRIVIAMVSREELRPLTDNALVNILGRRAEETRVRFRVYAVDYQGNRLANVEYYAFKLGGFLGRFARLEGAGVSFNAEKNQYEVHGLQEAEVNLIFPAFKDKEFAKALEKDEKMQSDFGITLDVDVAFKPERRA
jgi:hypothetical protein